jgi:hypothetical protein
MRLKIYKTIILKRRNARANSKLNEAKITTFYILFYTSNRFWIYEIPLKFNEKWNWFI